MQVGIVGMGIMGSLLALALQNAGWQVTLFDQTTGKSNCSLTAAGLLTPFSELDKADFLIFRLGQETIHSGWPLIINQLSANIYFKHQGSVMLCHPQDEAEWQHFNRRIARYFNQTNTYLHLLTAAQLVKLEPELDKFKQAYYFPDEAQIDSQAIMAALKTYLLTQDVKYVTNTTVVAIKPKLIDTGLTGRHRFDLVVDCRGLGAKLVFPDLRAVRGELIWLHAPEVNLQRPVRLLHPRYNLYIVPRPDDIYLIGASEIEAEDYSPISVQTTLELLTAAYYVHAGFAEARIIKTSTHCRPALLNHLPRIKYTEGLIAVNGLYRHGFLIAPALAADILRALKTNLQTIHYPEIWEINYD
ncbi:FAD-dependent oxidoreductase [Legionella sp. D16C41]|uniref:FAD-dependent oxidoreductase n=1 Tax=Legionella sp. D16C41 TaxID=3402688 RepID=UPI003AF8F13C